MRWRRNREDVEPFSAWQITTAMSDGTTTFELRGHVWDDNDPAESLRYVDAIASGLRDAGFPAVVTIVRESRDVR